MLKELMESWAAAVAFSATMPLDRPFWIQSSTQLDSVSENSVNHGYLMENHGYLTENHGYLIYPDIWVCLKMLAKPLNPMVNDHDPYEKWLFHWEYTQHDKPV